MVEQVGGARAFRRRIMEMGLVPGVQVAVVAVAPLGDPLTLALRGGRLSIRKSEAARVLVSLADGPAAARSGAPTPAGSTPGARA